MLEVAAAGAAAGEPTSSLGALTVGSVALLPHHRGL